MGVNLERIALYRTQKKLTKKETARRIQMSITSYQRKEAGITDFTSKEISRLAEVLEVQPSDLFDENALF